MTTGGASGSSSDPSPAKRKGWPKGRKRRLLPKDSNAPKPPTSGYMLFMNDQKELLKQSMNKPNFLEVTKTVATKWAQLAMPEKQKYLEAAEQDKERFQREFEEYRKTDSYKAFIAKQEREAKKLKKETNETKSTSSQVSSAKAPPEAPNRRMNNVKANPLEIPIFTEEFLSHNKGREAELRQLRKSTTEYEEQNAILQKHIESMRSAIEKLESEKKKQEENNSAVKKHLLTVRQSLTHAFASIPIPGTSETPTEETVDNYVSRLHLALTSSPQQHQKLIQNVKSIVNGIAAN